MARLHEYQGKAVLAAGGFAVPRGRAAASPAEARAAAEWLFAQGAAGCVIKIQAWTTGRAAIGGIAFAETPAQAEEAAARLLAITVGQFPVMHVLVEERLDLAVEIFLSLSIDERARRPVLLIAAGGGTGVEERAAAVQRIACAVGTEGGAGGGGEGPDAADLARAVAALPIAPAQRVMVEEAARRVFTIARAVEARSVEINPLAITRDGRLVAADCRITIDDYAVARHPELGIDFARELDHPPTALEKIAYTVEQADHRGTFFFAQMNTHAQDEPSNRGARSPGLIGFHGAGGGGSMMSMDAITHEGFTLANFCDTSGNPSPAKVYRAARIILQQPGLVGYFGSGSGVANQEQFWSAYGLAKAFWEMNLDIPAVIRLGGNTEDRAVEILQSAAKGLPAPVEGYRKTDPPAKVAARLAELVRSARGGSAWQPRPPRRPAFVGAPGSARFELKGGRLWIDAAAWATSAPAIIARSNGLLKNDAGRPALTVKPEEFLTRDSDMIACEVECRRDGVEGVFVELDISGLTA